jgi:cytochrome c5
VVIVLLVNYVDFGSKPAAGSDGLSAEAVARRLQPVGRVEVRDASAPAVLRSGEQVYQGQCAACHAIGAAGAPKLGDAAAWAPRIRTGYDALHASALKGKGAMSAQGGGEYSDFEIGRAVVYLANQAGGKLEEPKAPAAAASAASPAASSAAAPTSSAVSAIADAASAPK